MRSLCPRDGEVLSELAVGVTHVQRCDTCRGVWGGRAELQALVGGAVVSRSTSVELEGAHDHAAPACPSCGAALRSEETQAGGPREVLVCAACQKTWLDASVIDALRAKLRTSRAPAPLPPPKATDFDPEDAPTVFMPRPWIELVAIPIVFAIAWAISWTTLGELVSYFPRIQFHELGHALVAWSTGRRALPLPCGLTFWSEERAWFLVAFESAVVLGVTVQGARLRNVPLLVTATSLAAILFVGVSTPLETSEPWLVAGGGVGEILLPALAAAAFHLPLPRRSRWDFWRWPLLVVALFSLASVSQMWFAIEARRRDMPFGSFLGTGDGDLDRLIRDYGYTEPGLRALYAGLVTAAIGIALVPHLVIAGVRVVRERKTER